MNLKQIAQKLLSYFGEIENNVPTFLNTSKLLKIIKINQIFGRNMISRPVKF